MEYTSDQKQPKLAPEAIQESVPATLIPSPWPLGKDGAGQGQGPTGMRGSRNLSPKQASSGSNSLISRTTEAFLVPALSRRRESKKEQK